MYSKKILEALDLALKARANAHAPYSKFTVGAAVKAQGHEQLFVGCNVENASYGATICAERTAILQMVAQLGKQEIDFLVLTTRTKSGDIPCALCLQVMSEFCSNDFMIYVANDTEIVKSYKFSEFLPHRFTEF